MLAIPRRYLPDTVEVKVPKKTDGFGGQFEDPVVIENVRFEPKFQVRSTAYKLQDNTRGLLIVDRVNSRGAFDIPAGSLVMLPGEPAPVTVLVSHPIMDINHIHHWEIELS